MPYATDKVFKSLMKRLVRYLFLSGLPETLLQNNLKVKNVLVISNEGDHDYRSDQLNSQDGARRSTT